MKKYDVKIEVIQEAFIIVNASNKIEAERMVSDFISNANYSEALESQFHTRYNYVVNRRRKDKRK